MFFLATGATVRLIAPLLADKHTDPGVVCVDEARRFAVALAGGHGGGANALATRVAAVLGAQPVITTASDATGSTGLDELVELLDARVDGDLAAAGTALLDGAARVHNPLGFPLPPLPPPRDAARHTILITDRTPDDPSERHFLPSASSESAARATGGPAGVTRLVPRTLVVGIGSARGVPAAAVIEALDRLLHRARVRSAGGAWLRQRRPEGRRAGHPGRHRAGGAAHLPGRGAGHGGRAEPERGRAGRDRHTQRGRGGGPARRDRAGRRARRWSWSCPS